MRAIEAKISEDPETQAAATSEKNRLKLARRLTELLLAPDRRACMERDELNIIAWERELNMSRPEDRYFPEQESPSAAVDRMFVSGARNGVSKHYGQLKLRATSGYCIGDQYLGLAAGARGGSGDFMVTVLGATRNNDMCVVMRVLWNGEVWWLKMGPEAEVRRQALEALDDFSPPGAWERWFQAERDMLSRSVLGSPGAFAVAIEAARNRPAMLVRDAGDSLDKRLERLKVEPAQVYEMSKQLCSALEAGCDKGVVHGDVCLENICEKDGSYSLIDWGLACGRAFEELAAAVGKAWPAVDVANYTPGIPNWEMSPDCCFLGLRPSRAEHDLESLLYCCLKLLGGDRLPWSQAAACGSEQEVLDARAASLSSLVQAHARYIYTPLLLRLGLLPPHHSNANLNHKP